MKCDKELLNKVYNMYAQEKVNENPFCVECKNWAKSYGKELVNGPIPIFHIGKNFSKQKKKLLIVGLVAYGWADILGAIGQTWKNIINNELEEVDSIQNKIENRVLELYSEGGIRYLDFISNALEKVYGNYMVGYDNIAITNLVHCNTGDVKANSLPKTALSYCIDPSQLGLIQKEIRIINPTHILILTQDWNYTKYISNLYNDKENYKIWEIPHPSGRGRIKEEFAREVIEFMEI